MKYIMIGLLVASSSLMGMEETTLTKHNTKMSLYEKAFFIVESSVKPIKNGYDYVRNFIRSNTSSNEPSNSELLEAIKESSQDAIDAIKESMDATLKRQSEDLERQSEDLARISHAVGGLTSEVEGLTSQVNNLEGQSNVHADAICALQHQLLDFLQEHRKRDSSGSGFFSEHDFLMVSDK